ncbi:MAG: hypothetical protein WCW53_15080, partial [Syntrophales bacterium]
IQRRYAPIRGGGMAGIPWRFAPEQGGDFLRNRVAESAEYTIRKALQILRDRPPIKKALANRNVLSMPAEGNADSCIITTLSPSDKEYDNFIRRIAALVPSSKKTKIRAPSLSPNDTSVAIWIETGDIRILLGSDLEEKDDPSTGWSTIVHSTERPKGQASIFKIPHHGSITGHHNRVWSDMMIASPFAVVSPFYNAGMMLPTGKDVKRIVSLAPNSYITSRYPLPKSKISRPSSVERTIKETVGKIRAALPPMGWVKLRNGGKSNPNAWSVDLSVAGSLLSDVKAS